MGIIRSYEEARDYIIFRTLKDLTSPVNEDLIYRILTIFADRVRWNFFSTVPKSLVLKTLVVWQARGTERSHPAYQRLASYVEDIRNDELIRDKVIDIHESTRDGITYLHSAVIRGEIPMISELIERGVKIGEGNIQGNTALHYAVFMGKIDCVSLLLKKGAPVDAENDRGQTALDLAVNIGQKECAEKLLENGAENNEGNSLLHLAVIAGNTKFVERLLKEGVPYARNKDGTTPLHKAAACGRTELFKPLLEYGASINEKNNFGYTPLDYAAANGQIVSIKPLLALGSDEKIQAIHTAANYGHPELKAEILSKRQFRNLTVEIAHSNTDFADTFSKLSFSKRGRR